MRIAVAGGGPGGLFFATLIRRADPSVEVTVFERNSAEDTFGFGVVFSDRTLAAIDQADPVLREALAAHGRHWEDIEVRVKGERILCGGNGMAAIARQTLLSLLQQRAQASGAEIRFCTPVTLQDLSDYDLVVAADGTNSTIREQLNVDLGIQVDTATAKFIWFGTDYLFDGLTFIHQQGPDGLFAIHGYPISDHVSTFIVETDEESWRRAGLDEFDMTSPPGASDMMSKQYLERRFADQIDGMRLLTNNSRWGNFRTRRTRRWHVMSPQPVALLGDAAHTAHFSVGSGTKMAMEDAIAMSQCLIEHPGDLGAALAAYEHAAQPAVRQIQDSARPSLSWWEHFGRYHEALEPWQFAYHFLSRSITDARLARRAPSFVEASHREWVKTYGSEPLDTPFTHAGWSSKGRIVRLALGADGSPSAVLGTSALQLSPRPLPAAWGALVNAPDTEAGLAAAARQVADSAEAGGAVLVAVYGGTPLTRTLLCEQARMRTGLPALLIEPHIDQDRALTAVLSGRTDLVGVSA